MLARSIVVLGSALVLSGPTAAGQPGTAPSRPEETYRQVAVEFGRAVEAANADAAAARIDYDAMLDTAMEGIDAPQAVREGFQRGVKRGVKNAGFTAEVIHAAEKGARYTLLRVLRIGGEGRALFRMIFTEGGVAYHDLVIGMSRDGKVRIKDVYVYYSGERLSQILRRAYIAVAADANKGLLDRLSGWESDYVKNLPVLKKMTESYKAGQHREVLKAYLQLPDSLKKDKSFLVIRVQAAQALGDERYAAAMEDFRRYYPDDPCLDLLGIDVYAIRKDYARALASIDRLDRSLGGDPYLSVLRAGMLLRQGNPASARKAALGAIGAEPDLVDGYWTMVTISLEEKAFDDTLKWLKVLRDRFDLAFQDLTTVPEYAEFVRSPQYQAWRKIENRAR